MWVKNAPKIQNNKLIFSQQKQEQDKEIGDLAKNLSVCAKTFGQSTKTKSSEIVGNQTSDFSKINTDKETAKDCLWCFSSQNLLF